MLIVASVLSLILLSIAIYAARDMRRSLAPFFVCGLLFSIGPPALGMVFFPVVMIQFLVLAVLVPTVQSSGYGKQLAWPVILAATVLVYGGSTLYAFSELREFERLRTLYPYESMEERLPEPGSASASMLSSAAGKQLDRLERNGYSGVWRAHLLKSLHENTVGLFINSPGFGFSRMQRVSEQGLQLMTPDVPPVPQPVPRTSPIDTPKEIVFSSSNSATLNDLHFENQLDFANLAAAGYVKDRRHVAGFRPHRISEIPNITVRLALPPERLTLETVDLVGLLRHAEPLAYVSADLPRMDELRTAPTRPLDAFESAALKRILEGEDLITADVGAHVRMLGSIRTVKQCVQCHGGERGDLLGAFSYTFRRDDPGAWTPSRE
jgi:hypothetical protein